MMEDQLNVRAGTVLGRTGLTTSCSDVHIRMIHLRQANKRVMDLAAFRQLQSENLFTDMTLVLQGGRKLAVHSLVIAANSKYLKPWMESTFVPDLHYTIILPDVDYREAHALCQILYGLDLSISQVQFSKVEQVANFLGIAMDIKHGDGVEPTSWDPETEADVEPAAQRPDQVATICSAGLPICCWHCNLSFKDLDKLQKHLKTHKGEQLVKNKRHKCQKCKKILPSMWKLRQHLLTHKSAASNTSFDRRDHQYAGTSTSPPKSVSTLRGDHQYAESNQIFSVADDQESISSDHHQLAGGSSDHLYAESSKRKRTKKSVRLEKTKTDVQTLGLLQLAPKSDHLYAEKLKSKPDELKTKIVEPKTKPVEQVRTRSNQQSSNSAQIESVSDASELLADPSKSKPTNPLLIHHHHQSTGSDHLYAELSSKSSKTHVNSKTDQSSFSQTEFIYDQSKSDHLYAEMSSKSKNVEDDNQISEISKSDHMYAEPSTSKPTKNSVECERHEFNMPSKTLLSESSLSKSDHIYADQTSEGSEFDHQSITDSSSNIEFISSPPKSDHLYADTSKSKLLKSSTKYSSYRQVTRSSKFVPNESEMADKGLLSSSRSGPVKTLRNKSTPQKSIENQLTEKSDHVYAGPQKFVDAAFQNLLQTKPSEAEGSSSQKSKLVKIRTVPSCSDHIYAGSRDEPKDLTQTSFELNPKDSSASNQLQTKQVRIMVGESQSSSDHMYAGLPGISEDSSNSFQIPRKDNDTNSSSAQAPKSKQSKILFGSVQSNADNLGKLSSPSVNQLHQQSQTSLPSSATDNIYRTKPQMLSKSKSRSSEGQSDPRPDHLYANLRVPTLGTVTIQTPTFDLKSRQHVRLASVHPSSTELSSAAATTLSKLDEARKDEEPMVQRSITSGRHSTFQEEENKTTPFRLRSDHLYASASIKKRRNQIRAKKRTFMMINPISNVHQAEIVTGPVNPNGFDHLYSARTQTEAPNQTADNQTSRELARSTDHAYSSAFPIDEIVESSTDETQASKRSRSTVTKTSKKGPPNVSRVSNRKTLGKVSIQSAEPKKGQNSEKKTKATSFPCDQCDRIFPQAYRRNRHIREVHIKEREYVCRFCSKSFFKVSSLDRHELTHAIHNKWKCPNEICSKTFSDPSALKYHLTNKVCSKEKRKKSNSK